VESTRRGGPSSDRRGTAREAWHVLTVGQRRVADERGPAGSGRGREEREVRGARGPTRERQVGQARMNSDDCELFKWISNEFNLI
jgi:hypothetical protein